METVAKHLHMQSQLLGLDHFHLIVVMNCLLISPADTSGQGFDHRGA